MKICNYNFKKKILFIFFVLLIFSFFLNQESYAAKLNFIRGDRCYNLPTAINENKIFFPGFIYKGAPVPTKIYDLKSKKFEILNSFMSTYRGGVGIITYDDNRVLILGGYCSISAKNNCEKMAEIYNISDDRYELLEETMPLSYRSLTYERGLIKIKEKIFIITAEGIMEFDIKTKKFEKLLEYDELFAADYYNTHLLDSDNILIWGEHYKNNDVHHEEAYYANILKYNIPENKITEVVRIDKQRWENPISLDGIPLDNGRVMFLNGNENGGTIYIYDDLKGKIEKHGNTKFGTRGSAGAYLGDDKVLLVGGVINVGMQPLIRPTDLEYAILDLKTNKFLKVKTTKRNMMSNLLILNVGNGNRPMVFEY